MDRISSIDITYEGVPRLITFDSGNHPVVLPGSKITLNHTIHFSLTPEGQKVPLPQTNVPVEVADYTKRYLPTAHPTRGSGINVFSLLRYHSDMQPHGNRAYPRDRMFHNRTSVTPSTSKFRITGTGHTTGSLHRQQCRTPVQPDNRYRPHIGHRGKYRMELTYKDIERV